MITNKEELLEIIKTFGVNNQKRKFAEESFETIEAITKWEADTECVECKNINYSLACIEEEIADCLVLLRQFILFFNIPEEDLEKVIRFKTYRTLNRLKNGADKEIQP